MLEDKFDFSKKFKYAVEIHHGELGSLGSATLIFGKNHSAQLQFDLQDVTKHLAYGIAYGVLKARSPNGDLFTLFDCKCYGFVCYADHVVMGDVGEEFKAIRIRYSDVSEWFMHGQRIQGQAGQNVAWSNTPEHISVQIQNDGHEFKVSTETVTASKKAGENYLVNQRIVFTFENISSRFGVKDIRNRSHEMSNLFSILLAHPIAAISAWITEDGERWCPLYFHEQKRAKRDDSHGGFYLRCLASRATLDGKWKTLIDSYYKSDYRKTSWMLLAGMQRYGGFWEYRALGYVSILDKFVSDFSKKIKKLVPPSKDSVRKFRNALNAMPHALTDDQAKLVIESAEKAFSSREQLDFAEEYDYAVENSDDDVIRIINISKDDFMHIKKVRDQVAHGDAVTAITGDLTRESGIIDRITLLLTYWAFRDFGLTRDDFLKCFTENHNRLSLNPSLDRVHLDKVTAKAVFYTVPKTEFERISKITKNKMAFFFTLEEEDQVSYSQKYTDLHEEAVRSHPGKGGPVTIEEMLGLSKDQFDYWPKAYFECCDERLSLHSCYFIRRA
jgi:hypothetical protein